MCMCDHDTSASAQGRPPPNMPQWHIDCFELKLLEKQQVEKKNDIKTKKHSDPPSPFPTESGN